MVTLFNHADRSKVQFHTLEGAIRFAMIRWVGCQVVVRSCMGEMEAALVYEDYEDMCDEKAIAEITAGGPGWNALSNSDRLMSSSST